MAEYNTARVILAMVLSIFVAMPIMMKIGEIMAETLIRKSIFEKKAQSKIIYFDMDGVLAVWRGIKNVKLTKLPLYYLTLKTEQKVKKLILRLRDDGYDVRILSKAYENTTAAKEKKLWLKLIGLGSIPCILVPYTQSKLAYVADDDAVLVDDYSVNLHEWTNAGKTGIKFLNGINGTKGSWTGPVIDKNMSVEEMEQVVLALAGRGTL